MNDLTDYFRRRVELNLAQYPDGMVLATAREVELKIFRGAVVDANDVAWLIEACERVAPKIHSVNVTEGVNARDGH